MVGRSYKLDPGVKYEMLLKSGGLAANEVFKCHLMIFNILPTCPVSPCLYLRFTSANTSRRLSWNKVCDEEKSCLPPSEGLGYSTSHFHFIMNPLNILSLTAQLLRGLHRPCRHGMRKKKKKKTAHTLLHLTRESWLWCFPTSLQLKKKNYNPSRCMLALAEEERSLVVHDLANERTRYIHFKSTDIPLEPV